MNKPEVRLIVRIESGVSFGDPYMHLRTDVVYRDADNRWVSCYGYSTPDTLRGCDNLGVVAQADRYKAQFYGWEVAYSDVHRAKLDDIRLMAKAISRVHRRLSAMRDQLGYPATAPDYVIRFAKAVGCTGVRVYGYYDRTSPSQDEHGYVWQDAEGLKFRVAREQQEFAKKYDIKPQED